MPSSKLEVLVEFGVKPDQKLLDKTITELKSKEGIQEAVFKDGAIMVETSLPSAIVLDMVTQTSGKRAVLQGFGESQSAVAMVSSQSCCSSQVMGVIRFQQTAEGPLVADGSIDGLTPNSLHGLHVHDTGDLSEDAPSDRDTSDDEPSETGSFEIYDLENAPTLFEEYIEDFRKKYKDDEEKQMRYAIFVRNLEEMNKVNLDRTDNEFAYRIDETTDFTDEEMEHMMAVTAYKYNLGPA